MPSKTLPTWIALFALLLFAPGCEFLQWNKKKDKLTRSDIKRMIKEGESDLPIQLDEHLTLEKITLDYSGMINGWYTVSDELTASLRRVGNVKIEEKMNENIEKLDLDKCGVPEEIQELFEQQDFAIQYILEDKYGLHIASVVVSKETMQGDERVGQTQSNPFAVRNVSRDAD